MQAYEQGLRLFAAWPEEEEEIIHLEDIREASIRRYAACDKLELKSERKSVIVIAVVVPDITDGERGKHEY